MLVHRTVEHDARVRREARALTEAGHEVTIVHVAGGRAAPSAAREVRVVPALPPRWLGRLGPVVHRLAFVGLLLRRVLELRPDVVHAHDPATLLPALIGARFTGARLVYDSHEFAQGTVNRTAIGRVVVRALERVAIPRCAAVITVSEGIAKRIHDEYSLRSTPIVLRNFADVRACPDPPPANTSLRGRFGIGGDPLVLHQGAAVPQRGCETLVRAVSLIDDLHVVFMGDGDAGTAARLVKLGTEAGIAHRVHFAASVPLDEVLHLTREADVGVSLLTPSCENHRLALPNKVFEYAAAGVPVIVSAIPELTRLVERHSLGWAVDPHDVGSVARGLRTALERRGDVRLRGRIATAAHGPLSWRRERERLLDLYSALDRRLASSPAE